MISFVIPTLNEIDNINSTVEKIKKSFTNNENYEIIFVDDKSNDGSLEKIIILSKNNININYCIPEKRLGLGNALSLGQKKSKGDFIFFLDCDNSINITDLIKLKNSKKNDRLVIGSRYLKESRINGVNSLRIFLSRSLNFLVSKYLKIPAIDISHSCRIFPNSLFLKTKNFKHPNFFWEHSLYSVYKNLKIMEVPIEFSERKTGKSKNSFFSLFKNIFFALILILKLKFKYK